jgi:uncharacterized protein DUF5666
MADDFTVPPAPVATVAASDRRRATLARIGLLGIAAAALVAVALLAFGSSLLPRGTLAAGTGTTGSSDVTIETLNGGGPGVRGFGHGFGGITVTAISGNDIALETVDGWTRTITVDSGTTYSKSGDTIALADLEVGDEIAFRQTREDDGAFTIDAIVVIPPHAGGEVTAVNGSTITLQGRDGSTATVTVTSDTSFEVNGDDATLADVKVGMFLVAEGTENADGSLTATDVKAADPDSFPGPGRHGFKFGFGPWFDSGRDKDGSSPNATPAPTADTSAS